MSKQQRTVTNSKSRRQPVHIGDGSLRGWVIIVRALAASFALLACLFVSVCAHAQEKDTRRPAPEDSPLKRPSETSELTKDNFDRVAASVAQLKVILLQDAGLLVELKRWVAKEASDNGQVIADEDLTDTAVVERLANDVKFRSVATRLVQKYGYLLPTINPESEMGKQQELVLKQRAKRIEQAEAQEEQQACQLQANASRNQATCRDEDDDDNLQHSACNDYQPNSRKRNQDTSTPDDAYPRRDRLNTPEQGLPPNEASPVLPLMRAQSGGSDLGFALPGAAASSTDVPADLMTPTRMRMGSDSLVSGGGLTSDQLEQAAALYANRGDGLQALQNGDPLQELTAR